jgi:putative oxidoreductase
MKRAQIFLYHISRLALALTFVYAGAVKMQDVVAFSGHVAANQIHPYAMN